MKMIRAIIRPNKEEKIVENLEKEGFVSLTKMNVFGRGKQKGIRVGTVCYDEIAKVMLMLVVEDGDVERAVNIIQNSARTGNIGDGKMFVTDVLEAYTVRTGEAGL
ncbi:nitrogen regulatory protein PII [Candidatus Methanoperedens nitroreducens]|uniref:Nitrogen regulatory protein PII n=1 Tax=Candidatus Methanoperedens nitratireducens TaxID=1392998 RepID=A0A062VES3_9EURY|nr:P-II family nitrogen regulator [Candidatus Methanoperedens nitroreducens]KCZ73695.1 nitrogen regulatory protein PII [Candidatus Methanoperedens nitroreducens]MDJ1422346.1 P-II family nitrogen regulator [Candidatus Methanoperedens sp.]